MFIHTEDRIVYGRILTQGRSYDLLELAPLKRLKDQVPDGLRDDVKVFLVAENSVAKPLWVSHWAGYAILPSVPTLKPIQFEVEEGDQ